MKKCIYCAEEIKDEAINCRYCGQSQATGLAKFMMENAGLISFCIVVFVFWVFYKLFYKAF